MLRLIVTLTLLTIAPAFAQWTNPPASNVTNVQQVMNPSWYGLTDVPSQVQQVSNSGDINLNTVMVSSGVNRFFGGISSTAPSTPNAVVFKRGDGFVMTASSTMVSNTGQANESLISANVNVLNGLTIPVAAAGVTPTAGDLVKTASGTVCTRINGIYRNLASLNVVGNILTGIGVASPTACVF